MVSIREAIVVEGRYDKNTLSQIVDAPIFQTDGFGIMRNKEQLELLRCVAQKRGLIIFTDPDGAGFVIRNFLKGAISPTYLKHAYIPDIMGKERRKVKPGKEGKLGVEGMDPGIILDALRRAGATMENGQPRISDREISKVHFAELGLSGAKDSAKLRAKLLAHLHFPEHMSANALLQALNVLYDISDLRAMIETINLGNNDD